MTFSLRRAGRTLLIVVVALMTVFALASAAVARRFALPPVEAARLTLKAGVLGAIDWTVAAYDPVAGRTAELGPSEVPESDRYVRVEEFCRQAGLLLLTADNATIRTSPFAFRYQPYDEPRLHALRTRYGLDAVVAGARTEFEAMVRLRSWTRTQFRRRDYQPNERNFDALRILDRRLRNDTDMPYDPARQMDPCHFFPMLYCQVMIAAGHQARLVSILHGMSEVWSNQHRKWVLMDAELDLHYEKNAIPLSMLDMHNENFGGDPGRIRIVRGTQQSGDVNTTMVYLKREELSVETMVKQHREYIEITEMRNDWWSNHYFRGHPARSERSSLVFFDPRLDTRADVRRLTRPSTSRESDLSWTLNETEIWTDRTSPSTRPRLTFRTITPNFSHFELTVDARPPVRASANTFEWPLSSGINTLTIRSVNKFGIRGIPSSVSVSMSSDEPLHSASQQ